MLKFICELISFCIEDPLEAVINMFALAWVAFMGIGIIFWLLTFVKMAFMEIFK